MQKFYSNGKLLLSGEYLILDGALGLAWPTQRGQELIVKKHSTKGELNWESLDVNGACWFKSCFRLPSLELMSFDGSEAIATTLQTILLKAKEKNLSFYQKTFHYQFYIVKN